MASVSVMTFGFEFHLCYFGMELGQPSGETCACIVFSCWQTMFLVFLHRTLKRIMLREEVTSQINTTDNLITASIHLNNGKKAALIEQHQKVFRHVTSYKRSTASGGLW